MKKPPIIGSHEREIDRLEEHAKKARRKGLVQETKKVENLIKQRQEHLDLLSKRTAEAQSNKAKAKPSASSGDKLPFKGGADSLHIA